MVVASCGASCNEAAPPPKLFRGPRARFEATRLPAVSSADYRVRLARDEDDLRAAQALRFAVFNLELKEGLDEALASGLDSDPFDAVCDHLLVECRGTGEVVGTYRLQPGFRAALGLGYYSEQEFDCRNLEPFRHRMIELGRACVHRQHRNRVVLGLLWRGIAEYARRHGGRYLFGCSSLSTLEPAVGASVYNELCRFHLAPLPWRVTPLPDCECPLDRLCEETPPIPKLLRAYLAVGAQICGPPALDRQFKTIDFLTLLDLETLPAEVRKKFLD